jgi:2-amino-4-hydroxy-6-hydroxymethyldihydropteridine diphosphokinase
MPTTDLLLIALGSNQRHPDFGRPHDVLRAAIAALRAEGFQIIAQSRIITTIAVGPPQPNYANGCLAAIAPASLTTPPQVLEALQTIERRFGRRRRRRWTQRVLDLDLIGWGDRIWPQARAALARRTSGLIVPHPLAHTRAFVMTPLVDVAPNWRHPLLGRTARQLKSALQKARSRR